MFEDPTLSEPGGRKWKWMRFKNIHMHIRHALLSRNKVKSSQAFAWFQSKMSLNLFCGSRYDDCPHLVHSQTVDRVLVPTEWWGCWETSFSQFRLNPSGAYHPLCNDGWYKCTTIRSIVGTVQGWVVLKRQIHLLVTVLLEAVSAVSVFTSHRKICRSKPADATSSLSLA